jgi:hypothetical protein
MAGAAVAVELLLRPIALVAVLVAKAVLAERIVTLRLLIQLRAAAALMPLEGIQRQDRPETAATELQIRLLAVLLHTQAVAGVRVSLIPPELALLQPVQVEQAVEATAVRMEMDPMRRPIPEVVAAAEVMALASVVTAAAGSSLSLAR